MKPYSQLSKEELTALKEELEKQFEDVKGKGLKLDMSRGKPSKAQLDLSNGMMYDAKTVKLPVVDIM